MSRARRRAVVSMPRFLPVALVVSLVASVAGSCSSDDEGWKPCRVHPGDIPHPTGATDVVFQIQSSGGLPPPAFVPDQLPELTLYGDGRGLMIDPTSSGDRVEGLLEVRLSEGEMQRILHAAEPSCMLERDQILDIPDVYDVPGTVFTASTGEAEYRTFAVALGSDALASLIPERQVRQREVLLELGGDVRREMMEGSGAVAARYDVERLGVFFARSPERPTQSVPTVTWPLEEPLATFGRASPAYPDVHCAVTTGRNVRDLLSVLDRLSTPQTPYWQDGGAWYQVVLRPMLPHEADCAALVS